MSPVCFFTKYMHQRSSIGIYFWSKQFRLDITSAKYTYYTDKIEQLGNYFWYWKQKLLCNKENSCFSDHQSESEVTEPGLPASGNIREYQGISKSRFWIRESQGKWTFLEKIREKSGKKSGNFIKAFVCYF